MCLEVCLCYKNKKNGMYVKRYEYKPFWNTRYDNVEILHFLYPSSVIVISGYCPHCLFKSFHFNPQRNTQGTQKEDSGPNYATPLVFYFSPFLFVRCPLFWRTSWFPLKAKRDLSERSFEHVYQQGAAASTEKTKSFLSIFFKGKYYLSFCLSHFASWEINRFVF